MTATSLNVLQPLLSITMINYSCALCGCGIVINVRSIYGIYGGVSSTSPGRGNLSLYLRFVDISSITGFYFQTDKQEEVFNNFKIRNYLIIHVITVVVLLFAGLMDSDCRHS